VRGGNDVAENGKRVPGLRSLSRGGLLTWIVPCLQTVLSIGLLSSRDKDVAEKSSYTSSSSLPTPQLSHVPFQQCFIYIGGRMGILTDTHRLLADG